MTAQEGDLYQFLGGGSTDTDEVVTASSVMGLSTAWACVNLLAGTQASLSLDVYRKDERRIKMPAPDHPLQAVLDDPNADQTPVDFWEMMCLSLELWGNAYARIGRRQDGSIISLTPIRPEIMQVKRAQSGHLEYRWHDGQSQVADEDNIFHIRGHGGDPMGGMSTLSWNRSTFGTAQAIERAANRTFVNGIRAPGALVADKQLTPEQMMTAEKRITDKYAGAMNAGRPLLLNSDFKWQQISFNPEEAQMLESRGFSVEQICRVFGVPPFMVGHTEKVTSFGSGLEQQILGFQKFTLRKRLKKIEQSIRKQLLTVDDRRQGYTVSFNLEDLLRGDSRARSDFYRALLDGGVITINEVRALEGLPPVEGGDIPRMQMQNVPISEAKGKGGASPEEQQ